MPVTPDASETSSGVTSEEVVRGGAWALLSTIVPQVYTFTTSVVIARTLGAEGVGKIAFIAFATETLVTILVAGLPQAFMRYLGETLGMGHPGMIRTLSRPVAGIFLASATTGFVILTVAAMLGVDPRAAWIFAAVACSGAILHSFPSAILMGLRRWRDATIVGLTTGALGVVAKVGSLLGGGGVTALFAIDAAIVWLNVVGTALLARRAMRAFIPQPAEPYGDLLRRVLQFAAIGSISLIISLVSTAGVRSSSSPTTRQTPRSRSTRCRSPLCSPS